VRQLQQTPQRHCRIQRIAFLKVVCQKSASSQFFRGRMAGDGVAKNTRIRLPTAQEMVSNDWLLGSAVLKSGFLSEKFPGEIDKFYVFRIFLVFIIGHFTDRKTTQARITSHKPTCRYRSAPACRPQGSCPVVVNSSRCHGANVTMRTLTKPALQSRQIGYRRFTHECQRRP
jgi:hypothetical protein